MQTVTWLQTEDRPKRRRYLGLLGARPFVALVLALQLVACGTIIHPERKGQSKGRVDPAIAVLDGVGLLLFLIPGIIAFAVDFHTGAIYLPADQADIPDGSTARPLDPSAEDTETKVVWFQPSSNTAGQIEAVLIAETGRPDLLSQPGLSVYELDSALRYERHLIAQLVMAGQVPDGIELAYLLALVETDRALDTARPPVS